MSKVIEIYPKETAAIIKALLRKSFPATKFSVTTGRGSMVSSVHVHWTDGPTAQRVNAVCKQFEAGHFDGMTDSYTYAADRAVVVDGVTYEPCTKYVFPERKISSALARRGAAQVAAYFGVAMPGVLDMDGYWKLTGDPHIKPAGEYASTLIYQAASDATKFARR